MQRMSEAAQATSGPIPPRARELLRTYVNRYEQPFSWRMLRTRLKSVEEQIPTVNNGGEKLREKLWRSTYMRPV